MEQNKIAIISNLWTLMMSLEKGDIHKGHSHTFDHTHLLTNGKVKITVDGKESIYEAPTQIMIRKGTKHSIECLSDRSLGWCIHAIRTGTRVEDIIDPELCPAYKEGDEIYPGSILLNREYEESEAKPWGELSEHDNPKMAETK